MFIGKLEDAIAQQTEIVNRSLADRDSSKADWRGRYTKSKAMENAVERLQREEEKAAGRKEQAESDDRSQYRRR